jgi:hypothetical protein
MAAMIAADSLVLSKFDMTDQKNDSFHKRLITICFADDAYIYTYYEFYHYMKTT